MTIRIAAIGVSHWHSLHDSAYLRHLAGMPGYAIVGVQDPDGAIAAKRAAALGQPPVFTDHRTMLKEVRPDFVIALGRHRDMPQTAHDLVDAGVPFMMEKPMGVHAGEVARIADEAAARRAFVAVPLIQRYGPFFARAQQAISEGRLGALSHFYFRLNRPSSARYPAWDAGWMLDPEVAGGGCLRNLGSHGLDLFVALMGETTEVLGAATTARALGARVEDYASVLVRSREGVLGTIEVGNLFPRDGTDGESKLAGRDGILIERAGTLTLERREGAATERVEPAEPLARLALRDILDRFQRGAAPRVSVHDLVPVVRLIDRAYELAAR